MRSLFVYSFVAILFCLSTQAKAQSELSTSKMEMEESISRKGFFDLYSESSYYYDFDVVTDTRLRYFQPLTSFKNIELSTYLGASMQYQSAGAREKYYDDTVNPHLGLQLIFLPGVKLQGQIGYRKVIGMNDQESSMSWDPRLIFMAGRLWMWGATKNFTEGYGEVSYVPRIDKTPVSVVWVKQGYRWMPNMHVSLDAYGEYYGRESRNDDLGPTMTEWRVGGRGTWTKEKWNVSALIYHPIPKHVQNGELEGLLALGGNF